MQDGLILAGVQMPPAALRLMVVERARLAALRTQPLGSVFMDQMNVNFSILQLELNEIDAHGDRIPRIWYTVRDPAPAHYELTHSNPG